MILVVKNLKKIYDDKVVVNINDLNIKAGETIGLVGNNGAGKTTFFRMLLDLIRPTEGEILSKGINVAQSDDWKNYTSSFLDEGFLIDYLTPEEYFTFVGSLQNQNIADISSNLQQYTEFFNGEILNSGKYIRDFSKGNQNKVGIASALMQKPELLILDEPFANLDPTTQIRLKKILKAQSHGLTTFISSHDLNHVTDVCNRIILLEKGQIIKDIITDANTLTELELYFSA
jgi:ABC-2 type transport system ATP-binding protein